MKNVWEAIAAMLDAIANLGAGLVSTGLAYEPELPEELRK